MRGPCEEIKETDEEHVYSSGLYSVENTDRLIMENRSSLVQRVPEPKLANSILGVEAPLDQENFAQGKKHHACDT